MPEVLDMTDAEYQVYRVRQAAASVYRRHGHAEFAQRVEAGFEENCSQVRLARFWTAPSPPLTLEFIEAWNEAVDGLAS
jgi:hypothetical protein